MAPPEGAARYEAAVWQEADHYFSCEIEVYSRLAELQGELIPRIYAHVRVAPSPTREPSLPEPHVAPYFEVKGVLWELITEYDLWDLPIASSAPSDPEAWGAIVQSAV